jgi:hypothetical protein
MGSAVQEVRVTAVGLVWPSSLIIIIVEVVAMSVKPIQPAWMGTVSVATRVAVQSVVSLVTLVWVASAVQEVRATVVGLV